MVKDNLNAISFRSWNFTSECLSYRNTQEVQNNNNLYLQGQKEFLKPQIIELRDFFLIYTLTLLEMSVHLLTFRMIMI